MAGGKELEDTHRKQPWGLRWRSSVGFVTFVVMFGILTDQLAYSLVIPVIPYQLGALGYNGIAAKLSWLLVAFSGTLVLTTPLIAHYSEVYRNRKIPLIAGLVSLTVSQIMFMEAPAYWLMVLARVLQGLSATVIWTVGLALLCDTVPERSLGRQFGITSVGLTIGNLVGPPVGGALYQRWGFRAPFIFGIIFAGIDLVARLLLVERHEAIRWGVDPMDISAGDKNMSPEAASEVTASEMTEKPPMTGSHSAPHQRNGDSPVGGSEAQIKVEIEAELREGDQTEKETKPCVTLLPHIVLLKLMKSPRATVCIVMSLVWGLVWIAQETTVVLHMNRVWGLDPDQAGIAFIAAVVPTVFSTAISGWLGDKYGSAPVGCAAIFLSLPWYGLITIEGSLAMFLTFLALEAFFASCLIPMVMLELSSVGRTVESVGYAHVYGALSLAYGIGTTVGPIIAGQMYDHIERGWFAIGFTAMGLMSVLFVLALFMLGERPLGVRLLRNKERTPVEQSSGQ